jgi:hypothetical protein
MRTDDYNSSSFLRMMIAWRFARASSLGGGGIGLDEEKKPDLQNRYLSRDLEFDDQPSYPHTQEPDPTANRNDDRGKKSHFK